jgi:DNA-binding NtrC family response regulator
MISRNPSGRALKQGPGVRKGSEAEGGDPVSRQRQIGHLDRQRSVPKNKTVLVVSGDSATRHALAAAIQDHFSHRVILARGVLEAQRLAAEEKEIHLLLMDASAPETIDMQLALWFRALYPATRLVLACDSLWEVDFHQEATREMAFLAKPFTARKLAQIVRAILV